MSLFTQDNFYTTQFIRVSDGIEYIEEACHRLIHLPYECDGLSHLELASATLNLIVSLFKNSASHHSNQKNKADSVVDGVIDFIHAHYMDKLTIAMLAQRVGTNGCYLKQVFKDRAGITIANYIRRHRLEVAFEMLASGHIIQDSLRPVGYNHIGYFSKIFKNQYGFSPKNLKL